MAEASPFRSSASAVQWSGRLLCRSLAAAMASAAVTAFLHPHVRWWGAVGPLPWWLACLAALTWAVLRAREKAGRTPPQDSARSDWEQAA